MRQLIFSLLLFVAVPGCHSNNEIPKTTDSKHWGNPGLKSSFNVLKKSKCFQVGPIGYDGDISREELALRKLMRSDNASFLLEELFAESNAVGELYALLGLRFINKAKYEEFIPLLKNQYFEVDTLSGDIGHHTTIHSVVVSIESGYYDKDITRGLNEQ